MRKLVIAGVGLALGVVAAFLLLPGLSPFQLFRDNDRLDTTVPGDESTMLDPTAEDSSEIAATLKILTVLPRDAIPAILNPTFLSIADADDQMEDEERVIGVVINGEARAYSVPFLSGVEIVNDVVGGKPIAVTW